MPKKPKSGKPRGSKMVVCGDGHVNYLKPDTRRRCSGADCRLTVKVKS